VRTTSSVSAKELVGGGSGGGAVEEDARRRSTPEEELRNAGASRASAARAYALRTSVAAT